MKVVIVNCFETYEKRADMIYKYFLSRGNDVSIIQSDFMHFHKKKITNSKEGYIFIESLAYYKNLSLSRMISHYKFAKDSFKVIEDIRPDLLYVILPPNSLAKFASKYKHKYKNTKLYFDIMDLWPETMPISNFKCLPPFTYWMKLRDSNLKNADYIITECDLYQKVLEDEIKHLNKKTLYLGKLESVLESIPNLKNDEINLCYLGSINNIIDIDIIKRFIYLLNEKKKTVLHIVGDGEKRDYLIDSVKDTGASVEFHGKIYDTDRKKEIFDKCHFGLNIMKSSVCVGLTMKSIDYFQYGLPIINNIKEDTMNIVEEYKVGFNINEENLLYIIDKISKLGVDEFISLRKNTYDAFQEKFSLEAFNKQLESIMND